MSKWLQRFREYQELSGAANSTPVTQGDTLQETPDNTDIMSDPEVAWRVAAMRRQCPRTGRVLFLTARAFAWTLEDAQAAVNGLAQPRCLSCGDPVDEVRRPRCAPCAEAAMIVLNEVREGVQAGKDGQAA